MTLLACKDVVSKFRDIFEKLGLCNPDERPTISSQRMEELEKWSDPNITPCVFVMTANGLQCITQETEDEGACPGIIIIPAQKNEKLSKKCQEILVKLRDALIDVKRRYSEWEENRLGKQDPGHRRAYEQAQTVLNDRLEQWDRYGCGALPKDVSDARDWVDTPLP
jgi:hypothetical protein